MGSKLILLRARKRYHEKKGDAKGRNIGFLISFEEWYLWLLFYGKDMDVDKLAKSNSKTLCMCRFGDEGPYSLENIYPDTLSGNATTSQKTKKQKLSKKWITPLGKYKLQREAAEAHNICADTLRKLFKKYPEQYYHLK